MLRLITFLIIVGISYTLPAQSISFDIDYEDGIIKNSYLIKDNYVFKINNKGSIEAVYIFNNKSEAQDFIIDPRPPFEPRKRFNLNAGLMLYINTFESIDYCKNYSNNSRAGIVGEICAIDDLKINYNLRIGNNSTIGIVGKLKSIGPYEIKYHINYSSNVRSGIVGKIKSIGNTELLYYDKYYSTNQGRYTGKLKQIGEIQIKYHESYSTNKGFEGKLKSIGNTKFNYHKNYSTNNAMEIVGKFKNKEGQDARLFIL